MSRCPRPMVEGGKTVVAPADAAGAGVPRVNAIVLLNDWWGCGEVGPALQMDDGTVLDPIAAEIKIERRLPTSLARGHHPACPFGPSLPDLSLHAN